jgi:hemerythrin superfamily protein
MAENRMTNAEAGKKGGETVRRLVEAGRRAETGQQAGAGKKDLKTLDMICTDHRTVEALFEKYEGAATDEKRQIASKICEELEVHTELEEQIFYPPILDSEIQQAADLVLHGIDEHDEAKDCIAQIKASLDDEAKCDELISKLQETIADHIEEEEHELFPILRSQMAEPIEALAPQLESTKLKLQQKMH